MANTLKQGNAVNILNTTVMKTFKVSIINIILLLVSNTLFGTVYTTTSDGKFNAANIWSPSKPSLKWNFSDTIVIQHQVELNSNTTLYGQVIVNQGASLFNNKKKLYLSNSAKLVNNGSIDVSVLEAKDDGITEVINNGQISTVYFVRNSRGNFYNNGTITTASSLINAWAGYFENGATGILNVGTDLKAEDNFTNYGQITVGQDVLTSDHKVLVNTGNITNGGVFKVKGPTTNSGVITSNGLFKIDWSSSLTNTGTISTNDYFKVNTSLTNNGVITAAGDFINYGQVVNGNAINVLGDLINDWTDVIDNYGFIYVMNDVTNRGAITNDGNMEVDGFANSNNGVIVGDGDLCHSNGITDPTQGSKGVSCKICSGESSNLPVTLASLKAGKVDDKVMVIWATAAEINNNYFEVLRSNDGVNFEVIGTVQGNGNSNVLINYQFADQNPENGMNFYRLRQVDFDGTTTLTEIVEVNAGNQAQISLYPNPANTNDQIQIRSDVDAPMTVEVYSMAGQLVSQASSNNGSLSLAANQLAKGMYVLRIFQNTNITTQKLQVN